MRVAQAFIGTTQIRAIQSVTYQKQTVCKMVVSKLVMDNDPFCDLVQLTAMQSQGEGEVIRIVVLEKLKMNVGIVKFSREPLFKEQAMTS